MVGTNERQNDPITKMTTYRNFRDGEYRIPVWQLNGAQLIRKFAAIIAAIIAGSIYFDFLMASAKGYRRKEAETKWNILWAANSVVHIIKILL